MIIHIESRIWPSVLTMVYIKLLFFSTITPWMCLEDLWAVRKKWVKILEISIPKVHFLMLIADGFRVLQSLTLPLPAMPYGFRRTLGFFLIFLGDFYIFFRTILSGFYLMREKGKSIILSGVFLFYTGWHNLRSFDLSLTLGRPVLSCLILVCVSQQRWLDVLGQKKASSNSLRREKRCSIFEQ